MFSESTGRPLSGTSQGHEDTAYTKLISSSDPRDVLTEFQGIESFELTGLLLRITDVCFHGLTPLLTM